jgi:hypothetical protein
MAGWSQVRETRTIRAGLGPGTVVRCGLMDMMLADLPVSVVFFFARALDETRLAGGLARALAHLPVFAGRLRTRDETLEIVCDDAGVPMTFVDVDEPLSGAIGRVTLPTSGFVTHVDAAGARLGGQQPLLTVQVSRLSGGGTALGCSWHHAVGDISSFMLLMRAWSASVEGVEPPAVRLVEDRDAYLDEVLPHEDSGRPALRLLDAGEAADLRGQVELAARSSRTLQVYLGDAEVGRMREALSAAAGHELSRNDALCAHLVSTIRRLDGDPQTRVLTLPVDMRRRYDLPPGAVGNLLGEISLPWSPDGGPETLAVGIRAAVDDFTRSHLSFRANRAFLDKIGPSRARECMPNGFDLAGRAISVSNWSRLGAYGVVFEGQRPAAFTPATSLRLPWASWLVEGFDDSGFLYTVALPSGLAGRLRGPDGRAALHRFRHPDDPLPPLVTENSKLL